MKVILSLLFLLNCTAFVHAEKDVLVFLIAGQSNAGGVAAFSPETNIKAGMHTQHPTTPGSTAKEVGIPTTKEAYPNTFIWYGKRLERLHPGKNLMGGYRDPNRHGIELPLAMMFEKKYPNHKKVFIKFGPGGHNLHTQWAARRGPDYKTFMDRYNKTMTELKKSHKNIRVLGLYWDQGESDFYQPNNPKHHEYAKAYEGNLRELFKALREDTAQADLNIYIRKHLFQYHRKGFQPIIQAQIKLSKENSKNYLLDLDLGSNKKNFKAWAWTDNNGHLSSKAYLELSKRIIVKLK